jgi:hypothetical protein
MKENSLNMSQSMNVLTSWAWTNASINFANASKVVKLVMWPHIVTRCAREKFWWNFRKEMMKNGEDNLYGKLANFKNYYFLFLFK